MQTFCEEDMAAGRKKVVLFSPVADRHYSRYTEIYITEYCKWSRCFVLVAKTFRESSSKLCMLFLVFTKMDRPKSRTALETMTPHAKLQGTLTRYTKFWISCEQ
jgi:hypothetical protein